MAGRRKPENDSPIRIEKKPRCPRCNNTSTLGYLNGRNGKTNHFCNNCSIEVAFDGYGEVISFTELSADGSVMETQIKKPRKKNKKRA